VSAGQLDNAFVKTLPKALCLRSKKICSHCPSQAESRYRFNRP
jgi:hypothetical protein